MNKLYLFYALLSASTMLCAMNEEQPEPQQVSILSKLITLPSTKIIEDRFYYMGLNHFNKITQFPEKFGGCQMSPRDIVCGVYAEAYRYNKNGNLTLMGVIRKEHKPFIIKALLQEYPDVIEELNQRGILTPLTEQKVTIQRAKNTTIILPESHIIKERFCYLGLRHFIEKTHFDETLANVTTYPLDVIWAVSNTSHHYNQEFNLCMMGVIRREHKIFMVKALLADYPETIEDLITKGVLTE